MCKNHLNIVFISVTLLFLFYGCGQNKRNNSNDTNAFLGLVLIDSNSNCTTYGTLAGKINSVTYGLTHARQSSEVVLFKRGNNASIVKANFENSNTLEISSITTDLNEASFSYYETGSCPINEDITPGRSIPQESFTIERGGGKCNSNKTTRIGTFMISIIISRDNYPNDKFSDISIILKD